MRRLTRFFSSDRLLDREEREALARSAAEDATCGVHDPETALLAELGAPPVPFDPTNRPEHAALTAPCDPRAEEALVDADRDREQLQMRRHWFSFAMLVVFVAADALGSFQVLRAMRIPPAMRWIGVLGVVAATFTLVHRASIAAHRETRVFFLSLFLIICGALTSLRLGEAGGEMGYSHALVLFVLITAAPLLAEPYVGRQAESWPLYFRERANRGVARAERARLARTREIYSNLTARREAWERRAAQARAVYQLAHRAASGEWNRFRKGA